LGCFMVAVGHSDLPSGSHQCKISDASRVESRAKLGTAPRATGSTIASRMLLASCYGHLGRVEEARTTWAELLKVNPDFSLTQRARVLPYKQASDFQRIAEGLAKAVLP
jgi:hypothetical protein